MDNVSGSPIDCGSRDTQWRESLLPCRFVNEGSKFRVVYIRGKIFPDSTQTRIRKDKWQEIVVL